jgi:hypothetical protein
MTQLGRRTLPRAGEAMRGGALLLAYARAQENPGRKASLCARQ